MEPDRQPDKTARNARLAELAGMAGRPEGRRFLARMLAEHHVLSSVYCQNAGVYRLAGLQEAGLELLRDLYEASSGSALAVIEIMLEGGF